MIIARSPSELMRLRDELAGADRIGVDIEGNGLYAYVSDLCVVQVSWPTAGGDLAIAIVDPFAVDVDILAEVLGANGPVKVLHDCTFDARLLLEHGVRLGNVRDTAAMAQLLGEPKSGLASLVESYFGVSLPKGLQDHNWAKRPFSDKELAYLAQDVRHLLELDDALSALVRERDIEAEVALEIDYKLATAFEPPRDQRPPHERIKGGNTLGQRARAALEQVALERERIAEQLDLPPFRVAPNGLLLELVTRAPRDARAVQRMFRNKPGGRYAEAWLDALRRGHERPPDAPPEKATSSLCGADQARHKRMKQRLTNWRKKEASERGVTLQVVIPGHCMSEVAGALATRTDGNGASPPDDGAAADGARTALRQVAGLGDARIDRYLETWLGLSHP